jgi:hypothetical protein
MAGSMKILGQWFLGLLVGSLLLAGYVFVSDKNAHKVDFIRGLDGLRAIHANWVHEGKPFDFDPNGYITTHSVTFTRDTNTYSFSDGPIKALASARSPQYPEQQHLIISEEGKLFWIGPDSKVAPVEKPERKN